MEQIRELEIEHKIILVSENDGETQIDCTIKFNGIKEVDSSYGEDADGNRGEKVVHIGAYKIRINANIIELKNPSFALNNIAKGKMHKKEITNFVEAFFPIEYKEIEKKCTEFTVKYFENEE
jgi:hypothetical protein